MHAIPGMTLTTIIPKGENHENWVDATVMTLKIEKNKNLDSLMLQVLD